MPGAYSARAVYYSLIATGRLISKTDLGKHVTLYDYNYNSQVTEEHGAGDYKKDILTSYNQLGQAVFIDDKGTQTYTRYQYDVAGRRLTESVTQTINGVASILQDNHLGYDKLGRLAVVQNGRYALTYGYDANGNRTMVDSFYVTDNTVRSNNTTGGTQVNSVIEHKTTWNTYDAMNRQVIADGQKYNANGSVFAFGQTDDGHTVVKIDQNQGHQFTYDGDGRRTSDTSIGKKLTGSVVNVFGIPITKPDDTPGNIVETYTYDAIGRLDSTTREGLEIDKRLYNANSQLVHSGINDSKLIDQLAADVVLKDNFKAAGLGTDFTLYQYNQDQVNQVEVQQVHNADGNYSGMAFHYNAAGELAFYSQDTNTEVHYHYGENDSLLFKDQFDQFQANTVEGHHTDAAWATTINSYDVNGHLVRVEDSTNNANARDLRVDSAGHILRKEQSGGNTYSLLVNDQVVGTSSSDYASDSINQSYVKQSSLAGNGAALYVTQVGDSLQSIAKTVWGDASLWYLIADANGLVAVDSFPVGSKILIPAREVAGSNSADTFKPYNPNAIVGDTTPNMPMPQGQDGCGGMGTIITAAIAVFAAVMTAGAGSILMSEAGLNGLVGSSLADIVTAGTGVMFGGSASLAGMGLAAGSAMVGSAVSQGAAIAMHMQKDFNWKAMGLAGLSAGITSGLPATLPGFSPGVLNTMAKAALANTMTQGIGVVTGLQNSFDWRNVAASGVGAGVGYEVGDWLGKNGAFAQMGNYWGSVARGTVSGIAAGATVAAMRGGKIEMTQIAGDAFGNALGSSLAEGNTSAFSLARPGASVDFSLQGGTQFSPAMNDGDVSDQSAAETARLSRYANADITPYSLYQPGRNVDFNLRSSAYDSPIIGDSLFSAPVLGLGRGATQYGDDDASRGYSTYASQQVGNDTNAEQTYHFAEGEREQLRRQRLALLGQSAGGTTNADLLGVSDRAVQNEVSARIAAGRTSNWDAASFALGYTFRKVGYEAWNIATGGFVGRQDARIQAEAEGRLSSRNFWKATAIDGAASVFTMAAGGRLGSGMMTRLGTGYWSSAGIGATVGASFNLMQQTSDNIIYAATNGQTGRYGFSGEELGKNALFGAALGGGAKLLSEYGNYEVRLASYRPGTLYSNPMPFELVAPEVEGANGADDFITFYHGTSSEAAASIRSKGIDLSQSRAGTDFGQGFYTTTDEAQAIKWAQRLPDGGEVLEFSVPKSAFEKLDNFDASKLTDSSLSEFFRHNRLEGQLHTYDTVSGPMLGNPWKFLRGADARTFGQQTSFHTSEALELLYMGLKK